MNADPRAMSAADDAALRKRIGDQVRLFRRLQHLTQVELARRIGMKPGPLNAIEQGRHVPTGRVLLRLAEALGASVDDVLGRGWVSDRVGEKPATYLTGAVDGERPYAQPMRLRDDPPPDPEVELFLDGLVREFLALEDACGAQKCASIPLRHPFTADDRGIELLAQQVRQFLGVGHAVIFDYLELFENAGLRVVFCPLPRAFGSLAYYDAVHANAFFFIKERQSVERQLFELAKRLGAIYLHTGGVRYPEGSPPDSLRIARKFAAFFLMPEAAMRATVAQTGIAPDRWTYALVLRLKHRFGVSAESFVIRLEELGLITAPLAKRFKTRIRRHYQTTHNQEPDGTRRILIPNGRLDDLRLVAGRRGK
ncbi:MAG TPA: helix-turn-helix domain-containing protein [Kiritimatiellia bacterium]|nr:helix-turn-helix domain-containing protein [Kiritimatiellia bacterium]